MEGVKQVIYLKKSTTNNPTKVIYNGQESNNSKQIANAFGNYFANVWVNLSSINYSQLHQLKLKS